MGPKSYRYDELIDALQNKKDEELINMLIEMVSSSWGMLIPLNSVVGLDGIQNCVGRQASPTYLKFQRCHFSYFYRISYFLGNLE